MRERRCVSVPFREMGRFYQICTPHDPLPPGAKNQMVQRAFIEGRFKHGVFFSLFLIVSTLFLKFGNVQNGGL